MRLFAVVSLMFVFLLGCGGQNKGEVYSDSFSLELIPSDRNVSNIHLKFEVPSLADGAVGHFLRYNLPPNSENLESIISYYTDKLQNDWRTCEDKVTEENPHIQDEKFNDYNLTAINIRMNKKRQLFFSVEIGERDKQTTIFITQYAYKNSEQFQREYDRECLRK